MLRVGWDRGRDEKVAEGGWVLSGWITVKCVGGGAVEGVVHLVNPY